MKYLMHRSIYALLLFVLGITLINGSQAASQIDNKQLKLTNWTENDYQQFSQYYEIEHQGRTRNVIVFAPPSALAKNKAPVVFMFHGSSGTGEKFWNISGWKEKAQDEGIIAVFPSANEYCVDKGDGLGKRVTTKWDHGNLEQLVCEQEIIGDDIAFFRLMVDKLIAYYPADKNRIYISGFSNGGSFVNRLVIEASDLIAAAAPAAGIIYVNGPPVEYIPVYYSIGSEDGKLVDTFEGPAPADDTLSELDEFIDIAAQYTTALSLEPTVYEDVYQPYGITVLFYKSLLAEESNTFRYRVIEGLEHQYPNGTNHPLVAADFYWNFFKSKSKK